VSLARPVWTDGVPATRSVPSAPEVPPTPDGRSLGFFADDLGAWGDRAALVDGARSVTYAELDARVDAAAAALGSGRRLVMIEAANAVEPVVAYLAALRARHPVLLVPGDDPATARALCDAYDPDVLVPGGGGTGGRGGEIVHRRSTSAHTLHPDLALLLSTSGSTGSAKLVRLSRRNLQANATSIARYLALGDGDRAVTTLPMQYCYGLSVVHSHLLRGAGLVLTDRSVVDPGFWDLFRETGATSFAGVPHTFDLLDRIGFPSLRLPTLRYVTQAGGRLAPETVRRYAELGERRGWQLFVMYGQTEATARMAYLPPALAASCPSSIGIPVPGGELTIEPARGRTSGSGGGDVPEAPGGAGGTGAQGIGDGGAGGDETGDEVGELVYRGANVMLGYAEGPTDLALGATVDALRTGDLARQRPDGLFEVVGRRSRFVKLYGLRIDLDRVERTLAEAGFEALCAGDDEALAVAVAAASGATIGTADAPAARQVQELVADRIGVPRGRVYVVEVVQLPRLPNGKPDHARVLRLAAAGPDPAGPDAADPGSAGPGSAGSDRAATWRGSSGAPLRTTRRSVSVGGSDGDRRAALGAAFRAVLGTEPADGDSFVGLGGDSLSYVEMSLQVEGILGVLPPDWHTTPVDRLAAAGARRPGRRLFRRIETSVVVRAVAIVLVVGTHVRLWSLPGGAHALLAVAGHNFARFQLGTGPASMARSLARVAVPSMCWIGAIALLSDGFTWRHAVLLNGALGEADARWAYWYVEALVQILVPVALVLAVPAVRRAERRRPFALAVAVTAAALLVRFDVVDLAAGHHRYARPHEIVWLFALGWAAALAATVPRRLVVTALAAVAVPDFFGNTGREWIVLGAVLAVVWLPAVPVPRPAVRPVGMVAAGSLYVYLAHYEVYPPLLRLFGPAVALAGAVLAGVAVWAVAQRLIAAVERGLARSRHRRAGRWSVQRSGADRRRQAADPLVDLVGAQRAVAQQQ
jgi:acyl-CoA synthetase (AMP-forming)/AMP-acid ligase II